VGDIHFKNAQENCIESHRLINGDRTIETGGDELISGEGIKW